jgi:hypothetical protein
MRRWKIIGAIVAFLFWVGLQLSGFINLPLAILLWCICVGLLSWSAWPLRKRISIKKGANKMLIVLGCLIVIGGIVGGGFLIKSQLNIKGNVEATTVRCCIENNIYHVWASNPPDSDKDTVFISLGTSSMITNVKALMGASLPTIIEGGLNANFITFKITELPPNVSLGYIIEVGDTAETPRNFTAWSEITKRNITVMFIGQCPQNAGWGPWETAPSAKSQGN